eukprot:6198218-Pleurochrysis_carterae.AAC.1
MRCEAHVLLNPTITSRVDNSRLIGLFVIIFVRHYTWMHTLILSQPALRVAHITYNLMPIFAYLSSGEVMDVKGRILKMCVESDNISNAMRELSCNTRKVDVLFLSPLQLLRTWKSTKKLEWDARGTCIIFDQIDIMNDPMITYACTEEDMATAPVLCPDVCTSVIDLVHEGEKMEDHEKKRLTKYHLPGSEVNLYTSLVDCMRNMDQRPATLNYLNLYADRFEQASSSDNEYGACIRVDGGD